MSTSTRNEPLAVTVANIVDDELNTRYGDTSTDTYNDLLTNLTDQVAQANTVAQEIQTRLDDIEAIDHANLIGIELRTTITRDMTGDQGLQPGKYLTGVIDVEEAGIYVPAGTEIYSVITPSTQTIDFDSSAQPLQFSSIGLPI